MEWRQGAREVRQGGEGGRKERRMGGRLAGLVWVGKDESRSERRKGRIEGRMGLDEEGTKGEKDGSQAGWISECRKG